MTSSFVGVPIAGYRDKVPVLTTPLGRIATLTFKWAAYGFNPANSVVGLSIDLATAVNDQSFVPRGFVITTYIPPNRAIWIYNQATEFLAICPGSNGIAFKTQGYYLQSLLLCPDKKLSVFAVADAGTQFDGVLQSVPQNMQITEFRVDSLLYSVPEI